MNPLDRTLVQTLFTISCALSVIGSIQAQDPTPTPSPTPPAYSVLDLGTLYGGGSAATAINNAGDVVGYCGSADNTGNRGFLYSGGSMVDVGTLAGNNTAAFGVNRFADVIGHSANADNTADRAFLYSAGNISDLGTLGGTSSYAYGINDSGQIVGISDTSGDAASHAFLYSGGSMTDLGLQIGGTQSFAYSINSAGDVAGWWKNSGPEQAFIYSNGNRIDLGTLGGDASVGYAINDAGQVTGWSHIANDAALHAFLYHDGTMTDLGVLDAAVNYSYGHALNNSGQVVGYGNTSNGNRAFLYTNDVMYDLNELASSDFVITDANGINDLGQIAATGNVPGQIPHALLLRPLVSAATGQTVSSPIPADSSYVTVPPVTNSSSANNTTAALIGGNATSDTVVNITFTDGSSLSGFQAASDVVNVSGTGSDVIVLQLSYNETEAISTFGAETDARLVWLDPGDQQWKLAVAGNTGGTVHFVYGPYDPAQDFHLGYYGVDTVNNVVWAVINHNSDFTTGNRAAVNQPANADLKITVTDGKSSLAAG
jgi:probable HAF family extracellular repeat protein